MMVSFLSLGVIPALRLTNRGLVDGREARRGPGWRAQPCS
jgi:adenine deaminase